ncbi:MAG TPA: hypothetical protein VFX61_06425 [Micromonosporaceae bacterium]|nr:hypothetical protein [Micromonosporaceae bacterium]
MSSIGQYRRRSLGTLLALLLTAGALGCEQVRPRSPETLSAGVDTRDGNLQVWPARGRLANDPQAKDQVTVAVDRWRTPSDDRAHLPSSGILWLGEVDGDPLALVAASVPGGRASWLLQLSGRNSGFEVTRAAEYTDPGYLVYADVLPVHLPTGRRYLTSARVQQLRGPGGDELRLDDGLSARADVPGCKAVTVSAALQSTAALPKGRPNERFIDLGTAIADPLYPLVRDDSGSGAKALAELDTCQLSAKTGPFGSLPRRDATGDVIESVPMSWPLDRISARSLGKLTVGQGPPARLEQLEWLTDAGSMSAIVYRPSSGPPVLSRADRANALQRYVVPVKPRPLVVLAWQPGPDTTLSLPPTAKPLLEQDGLVVLPRASGKQSYSLSSPHKTHYRSASAVRDGDAVRGPDRPLGR